MRKLIMLLLAVFVLLIASCERRDIYREGKTSLPVIVHMDWRNLGSDPSGATICFYPEDGSHPYTFKTNSVGRAIVQVPSGYYTVIVFNRTTEEYGTMQFFDMEHLGMAKAVLDTRYVAWLGTADTIGRVVYEPEVIVVGRTDHFYVHEVSSSYFDEYESTRAEGDVEEADLLPDTCRVTPQQMVMNATVKVRVHGIQNVSSVRGHLTGMAGGDYLATRSATDTIATHAIESWTIQRDETDYTKGYLVGTFRTFGLPEQYKMNKEALNNRLSVQLKLVDGETVIGRTFYVGDRVEEIEEELVVNVVVGINSTEDDDPITAPDVKPIGGSESGFDVTLEDWGDTHDVVVPM